MQAYSISATVSNTEITKAVLFVDDNMTGSQYPGQQSRGFGFDNADDIIYYADDTFNSSLWRKAPQACYNAGATQAALEYLTALIEQYWGSLVSFKELPDIYHETATLATQATIGGDVVNISSAVTISEGRERTSILSDSPFNYAIEANTNGQDIIINFNVLPSDAIQGNKIHLSTTQEYSTMQVLIYWGRPAGTVEEGWLVQVGRVLHTNVPQRWIDAFQDAEVKPADDDPYSGEDGKEDPSGPGGGGGDDDQDNYDDDSDPNPVPPLPGITAVDTGFITLYNPSLYQLRQLASYMWDVTFDIEQLKKMFAEPMECILGLSIVPVNVPAGSARNVQLGNITTNVSMTVASSQYVEVNCGTIKVSEKWHSYLDYSPYTKMSIFLPFIGSHELDIDLIIGATLGVVYHIDVLSGGCVAFVTVNGNVRYEFAGQCAMSVPVTARDFTQTILALAQLVGNAGAAVMSGGLSAPVSAASIAGGVTAAANTANNVISNKPRIQKSGTIGGSNGILGSRKPYIIIERPKLCAPAEQNRYTGYPAYITYTLSELNGFTQVQNIHLDIPCTDSERDEIMTLLREGVIL